MKLRALWLVSLSIAAPALALEGKWTPRQITELDAGWLASQGLRVSPSALWDQTAGGGVLSATVELPGCSGSLLSASGLVATNHHCIVAVLQRLSSKENDFLTNGFLAPGRAGEPQAPAMKVLIPVRSTDVTAKITAAVADLSDDGARFRALGRLEKELVAGCEKASGHRCRVASFNGGLAYRLVDMLEYPDTRLVFAPPQSVGDFGGEVDNWMWPRHAGDVALLRVWAAADGTPARPGRENVPLATKRFFPIAKTGIEPGAFVMAAGYPALSFRSLTAAEMGERAALFFPQRASLFSAWLDILMAAAERDPDARIALAGRIKEMANAAKNARAMVAGLERGSVVERKWSEEERIISWLAEHPEFADAAVALRGIAAVVEERRATWRHDFLLEVMGRGPLPLGHALTLVRWARERTRPDVERLPGFQERDRERIREQLDQDESRVHLETEKALMTRLLEELEALPEGTHSEATDRFLGDAGDHLAIAGRVEAVFSRTRVTDRLSRLAMFEEGFAQLRLRRDALIDVAIALDDEMRQTQERRDRWEGALARLHPRWLRAVLAFAAKPVAPDANGTLRVSFGHVQGYSPRDGLEFLPQTRLAGMVAKATGRPPFELPEAMRLAATISAASRFADSRLRDVPVAFLADLDTGSGSSGSAVLNGRGELVGLNFDRVWENVANDFSYDPAVARNISLDARFLLWTLETFGGSRAVPLLEELGVSPAGRTDPHPR